jgi:hypothetical protein
MTDPSNALQSFQQELLRIEIKLQRGVLDPDLYVYTDKLNEENRIAYVRLEGRTVTALVIFCSCEPVKGRPCFSIGYAVPEAYRNQGRAKEAIRAALAEMQRDGRQHGHSVFYVEAIVGRTTNPLSVSLNSSSPIRQLP